MANEKGNFQTLRHKIAPDCTKVNVLIPKLLDELKPLF